MGKITINELSNSLKNHLDGKQDAIDSLLETNNKSVVGAINELLSNVYGRDIIANAIGEPLTPNDSFEIMGDNINDLLSTFKTNMMNNGVIVESGDKFKVLIDKIATIADNESKGIQYAEGTIMGGELKHFSAAHPDVNFGSGCYVYGPELKVEGLSFKPSIVYIEMKNRKLEINDTVTLENILYGIAYGFDVDCYVHQSITNVNQWNQTFQHHPLDMDLSSQEPIGGGFIYTPGLTNDGFILYSTITEENVEYNYYAFGVGEDTTTLQSLESKQLIKNWNFTDSENLFMIKTDGSLWAYGYNNYGQLGLGDTTSRTTFTQVTTNINNDIKQVACGKYHTFILKNDGSVWACGYNITGQLGLGTSGNGTNKTSFTQVTTNINNDVKQIACGSDYTFILKNDGSIWSCGNGGLLGLGDTTQRTTFTQVTTNINNDVKELHCFDSKTYIIKNDDSIWVTGLMFDYTQTTFMQI